MTNFVATFFFLAAAPFPLRTFAFLAGAAFFAAFFSAFLAVWNQKSGW